MTDTILVRPDGARDLPGASPTALALSSDESRLYVAVSDMNAVAVVNTATGGLLGYLQAGWYPSALALAPDGVRLLIANAKGVVTRVPNPNHAKDRTQSR